MNAAQQADFDRVIAWLANHPGPHPSRDIIRGAGLGPGRWYVIQPHLRTCDKVICTGVCGGARYAARWAAPPPARMFHVPPAVADLALRYNVPATRIINEALLIGVAIIERRSPAYNRTAFGEES